MNRQNLVNAASSVIAVVAVWHRFLPLWLEAGVAVLTPLVLLGQEVLRAVSPSHPWLVRLKPAVLPLLTLFAAVVFIRFAAILAGG